VTGTAGAQEARTRAIPRAHGGRLPWLLLAGAALACTAFSLACTRGDPDASSIGYVDTPAAATVVGPVVNVTGWALARQGIARVDLVLNGTMHFPLAYGIARPDVAAVHPDFPRADRAGFEGHLDLTPHLSGSDELTVIAVDHAEHSTVLARRSVVSATVKDLWAPLLDAHPDLAGATFHVLFATSGLAAGGAADVDVLYQPYTSRTIRIGLRVPILYMRTTTGRAGDWQFDPAFPTARTTRHGRSLAEDSLQGVLDYSLRHALPVLLTLNGGVWADASGDEPEWDLNDHLEETPANCQWNEHNEVLPDDYLKNLPGSSASPELARMLTYNVYAQDVRRYKKRNLQQAGQIVASFNREHPDLLVGVNLDPDLYINPFFEQTQWYDYNPDTIRQFREWLAGTGPYGDATPTGAPGPLRDLRRRPSLSLEDVAHLTGHTVRSWDEVDPPRSLTGPFWLDPWVAEWYRFRRHLVHQHYNDLARWLAEVGVPPSKIYSSVGLAAPRSPFLRPLAVYLDSPVQNYDGGGVSLEGGKPFDGHIGVIIYGRSASNEITMETPRTLFATLQRLDPDWAVVEYNTAAIHDPRHVPEYGVAYRSLRDLFNYGARFVSPMAWNGSDGRAADEPGFLAFTAVRNTPLEQAIRDFCIAHANLPRGSLFWPFGTVRHPDADGWTLDGPGTLAPESGLLRVAATARQLRLVSPPGLPINPRRYESLLIGLAGSNGVASIQVEARTSETSTWELLSAPLSAPFSANTTILRLPLIPPADANEFAQLRLTFTLSTFPREFQLSHIALYPRSFP
jgi:hypothetical protein